MADNQNQNPGGNPAPQPTPPDNKASGEAAKNAQIQADQAKRLLEARQQELRVAREIAQINADTLASEGKTTKVIESNVKGLDSVIKQREKIEAKIQTANEEAKDLISLEKDLGDTLKQKTVIQGRFNDLMSLNSSIAEQAKEKERQIVAALTAEDEISKKLNKAKLDAVGLDGEELSIQQATIKSLENILDISSQTVEMHKESLTLAEAEYIALSQKLDQYDEIEASLRRQVAHEEDINRRMGIAGQSVQLFGKVLDHYGTGKFLQINKAMDVMRKKAEEGGSKMKVLGAGMVQIGKNMTEALSDPLTIITSIVAAGKFLIKNALDYQSKQFETAKALGISVTEGAKLKDQFTSLAWNSGKLALTSKELLGTYTEMTKELGIMGPTNAEFLQTSTLLERRIGASAESMTELQVSSAMTGENMMSTYKNVVGTGKAMAASLKINMSEKQILDSISKVSSTIYNNFHGNLTELTKAVIQAKKFGTTLDTVAKQGESMLDFESSISKEFEAQLLTGKDLNLSKARELALNHDTAGLMTELNSKMMNFGEYSKMNVLQQQSFAEALGLSKSEMDDIYKTQEKQNALGELASASYGEQYNALVAQGKTFAEISQIMGEQSANDAQKASVAEQYAATQERTMEMLAKSSQSLTDMVSKITEFFSHTENIKGTLIAVSAIMGGLVAMSIALKVQALMKKNIETTTVIIKRTELAVDQSIGAAQSANLAKEVTTTEVQVVGAGASATAGAGYLGPLALGVGALVIGGLMAYLMSSGASSKSLSGGGGGGGAIPVSPSVPSSGGGHEGGGISPMNGAAETKKMLENHSLSAAGPDIQRGGNTNVYVTVDPITGAKTQKLLTNSYDAGLDRAKMVTA